MLPTDPPRDLSGQALKTDNTHYLEFTSTTAGGKGYIKSYLECYQGRFGYCTQ